MRRSAILAHLRRTAGKLFLPLHLALAIGLSAACWCLNPTAYIADDSFFYLVAARRLSLEGQHSFSGVFPTNGVHPLHYYLLSLYSFVVGRISAELLWKAVYVVPLAVCLIALGAYNFAVVERRLGLRAGTLVFPPLVFLTVLGMLGSEAHVYFCALSIFARVATLDTRLEHWRRAFVSGLVLSLVFLSRLDSMFLVVSFVGWEVVRERPHARTLVALSLGFGLLTLPYLLFNRVVFGGFMPISGWLKSSFPHPHFTGLSRAGGILSTSLSQYNLFFGVVPVALSWAAALTPCFRRATSLHAIGVPLLLGATGHMFYTMVFASWCGWYWYYVLPIVSCTFFAAALLAMPSRSSAPSYALLAGLTLVLAAGLLAKRGSRLAERPLAMNGVMDAFGLGDSCVLVSDFPGLPAFRTHAQVIAADLLTGNRPLYDAMVRSPNAMAYLLDQADQRGKHVNYLLWVGGDFLEWDRATGDMVYRDPKVANREREIGRIHLGTPLYADAAGNIALWKL